MHRRSPKISRSEAAREHLTILHLSDPQFGKNHRFGSDEPFDTLFERLKEDLLKLRAEKGLVPDLVVVTGDLAEWGLKSEFEQALDFLLRLCDLLEFGRNRVAVIPGNHDINRKACAAYFAACEGDEHKPLKPYWPKWKHYLGFLESFYRDCPGVQFTEELPWSLFEMPELRVVVAGLNSTMVESHLDTDHRGWIGEAQLRWFRDRLEKFRERGWLRIGAVHHNVVRGAEDDDENLRDAPAMRRVLGQHLNLVLHGHTHHGALDWWGPELPLISTGSAALAKNALPSEFPNQYQFLRLWPDRFCRWSRQYALEQKRWIADPRVSISGEDGQEEVGVVFRRVSETFQPPREPTRAPLEPLAAEPESPSHPVPLEEPKRGDTVDRDGGEVQTQEVAAVTQLATSGPPEIGGEAPPQAEPAWPDAGCRDARPPAEPSIEGLAIDSLAPRWLAATACQTVAWQPDGQLLACGYQNGIIAIWESASGKVVCTLEGHEEAVSSVAWSPDGKSLASGSWDDTVRIWEVASGQAICTLEGHGSGVWSIAWSPNGQMLASGSSDRAVRVWELASGYAMRKLEGHRDLVRSVAWSPDGKRLASGSADRTVRLWNVEVGAAMHTLKGHRDWVLSVAWSPDGQMLASGCRDGTARVWAVAGSAAAQTLRGHTGAVACVVWSPDGKRLASGSADHTVRVWLLAVGSTEHTLSGHVSSVPSVAWSSDGQWLASASADRTVRVWEVAEGSAVRTLEGAGIPVWSVAWSPDGRWLASGSEDCAVRVWGVAEGNVMRTLGGHEAPVRSVAWRPDGRRLASSSDDGTLQVWTMASGGAMRTIKGHRSAVQSVAWSPDGQWLASGPMARAVRVWNAELGYDLHTLTGHKDWVRCVAWNLDGRRLASGSDDGTVRLWDAAVGSALRTLKGHGASISSITWRPDGQRLASGSADRTIRIWEVARGCVICTFEGHRADVLSVAWSPDGQSIASGSKDRTVRVWGVEGRSETRTLDGHGSAVWSVAWSPDGQRLASASDDGTIRLWNATTGACLAILLPLPEGWVAFTPDGRYKLGGHIGGGFWHTIGLCRFEPGELDPYLPQPLRIPDDQPLIPGLALPNETTLQTFQRTDEGKDLMHCDDAKDTAKKLGL